jgi:hypothetical protein
LGYFDRRLTLERTALAPGESDTSEHSLVVHHAVPAYNLGVTFHTPLGAFAIGSGLGWAVRRMRVSGSDAVYESGWASTGEVIYTAFITHDVFVQFGSHTTTFHGEPLEDEHVGIADHHLEIITRIGYFWPAVSQRLRGLP